MSNLIKTVKSVVRVAVVQASSVVLEREKCVDKLEKLVKEASGKGAELVLFPEAFISCYPRGTNFGAICGSRTKEGREKFRKYWDSSVEVPSPTVDKLGLIAKQNKVHLVVGVIEREGGTLYCCVLFFGDDGTYLGKHRKLIPTASERIFWGAGDGSTLPVFNTSVGKLGAVICWENYMPLLRTALYAKGIQIYCAPTADARDEWTASMRHIALEGRCFVLSCNQFIRKSDYPEGFFEGQITDLSQADEVDSDVLCRGGSLIVSPLGEIIAGPHYGSETTLYADLDLDDIPRSNLDFDPVGHYARPDIFTLHVNEAPNKTVVTHNHSKHAETQAHHGHPHPQHHHHHHPNCSASANLKSNNNIGG